MDALPLMPRSPISVRSALSSAAMLSHASTTSLQAAEPSGASLQVSRRLSSRCPASCIVCERGESMDTAHGFKGGVMPNHCSLLLWQGLHLVFKHQGVSGSCAHGALLSEQAQGDARNAHST